MAPERADAITTWSTSMGRKLEPKEMSRHFNLHGERQAARSKPVALALRPDPKTSTQPVGQASSRVAPNIMKMMPPRRSRHPKTTPSSNPASQIWDFTLEGWASGVRTP
jgi:hypothetical protein